MLKVAIFNLFSLVALVVVSEDIAVNEKGCPLDYTIFKILPHENCNQFYQCISGEPFAAQCPLGLLYNEKLEICDWPSQVDCENRMKARTPFTDTSTTDTPNTDAPSTDVPNTDTLITVAPFTNTPEDASTICARDMTNGLLIAHEYCNHLYMCSRGIPIDFVCPEPLLFNVDLKICDYETQVDCGDRFRENQPQDK